MSGRKWRFFGKREQGESSSNRERSFDRGDRPPKGLKGKEIGLWFARRNKRRREEEETPEQREKRLIALEERNQQQESKPLGSLLLSENKKETYSLLLNETSTMYPSSFLQKSNSYEHLDENAFKFEFLKHITGSILEKLESYPNLSKDWKSDILDEQFSHQLKEKHSSTSYQEMLRVRKKLPSMGMKDEILELIKQNQVCVISGETGCGKTTQVAQFILDDFIKNGRGSECKIICTQPRRISAISVAERVAHERDEKLGESVGYQIRLEKAPCRNRGSILFCTTGVLLKFMESDPAVSDISHLILDEIHERDVMSDFLITLLKDVIRFRSDLKIILMSATLNSEAFSKYYNNAPHINIPGMIFPVQEYFLEDVLELTGFTYEENHKPWKNGRSRGRREDPEWSGYIEPYLRQLESEKKYKLSVLNELRNKESDEINLDLVYRLLVTICRKDNDNGAILIFLPGFADISKICTRIREGNELSSLKYIVFPLHSQLSTIDQKQIFKPAPRGMRKIIVSTNIAETSITIDDVTTVIDSGYIKMTSLDPETGIEMLNTVKVSQANAAQRKGRAGRVKPGVCFHLITKLRYDLLDKFLIPEILRKRLDDVILQLKMLQLGDAEPFLSKLMDPPDSQSVRLFLNLLQRLGALNDEEGLTPLGLHMAKLPVGAHCSKMLIMGAVFSCLEPILSVAASLGFKDCFVLSMNENEMADERKLELAAKTNSDHICMHFAIKGFEESGNQNGYCRKYYLSYPIIKLLIDMRKQFAQQLYDMKFISNASPKHHSNNLNSHNISLVKAIIAAGLYPNIGIIRKCTKSFVRMFSTEHERMEFHKKSVLNKLRAFPSPLVVYHLRLKTNRLAIHDATVVFPLPIVFFGDRFKMHIDNSDGDAFKGISINGKMRFICTESTALIIQRLRDRFNLILEWKVSHPEPIDWAKDSAEVKILRLIMDMITTEDSEDLDLSDYDDL